MLLAGAHVPYDSDGRQLAGARRLWSSTELGLDAAAVGLVQSLDDLDFALARGGVAAAVGVGTC